MRLAIGIKDPHSARTKSRNGVVWFAGTSERTSNVLNDSDRLGEQRSTARRQFVLGNRSVPADRVQRDVEVKTSMFGVRKKGPPGDDQQMLENE